MNAYSALEVQGSPAEEAVRPACETLYEWRVPLVRRTLRVTQCELIQLLFGLSHFGRPRLPLAARPPADFDPAHAVS